MVCIKKISDSISRNSFVTHMEDFNFNATYFEYSESILRYCFRFTRCMETSKELSQDIFLKLFEASEKINPELGVKSYLLGIAKYTVIDWFRKIENNKKLKDSLIKRYQAHQENVNLETQILSQIDLATIQNILVNLPENGRKVYQLVRIKEYSYDEAAEELKISKDTVKYHLKIADKLIKSKITGLNYFQIALLISLLPPFKN